MNTQNQYISFARKYRPLNFSQLVGQEVLTKTISYSIGNNRLAQGYLLTGIRGVGKTTSARIIAKTINCDSPVVQGENIQDCEKCQNCESFNIGRHPDIIEIDAASRTSVDDIREIIESSEYRPLLGKYKVFIVDEVHMLSKSAFNALLKVLEEPPPHVIFIFATTEVQKVPLTVISRCQRYDLRRLTNQEIMQLLQAIAEKENLKCEVAALKIISHKAEGSARDATSILDQATSYSARAEGEITADLVNQMLGLVDTKTKLEFFHFVFSGNVKQAIELVNSLYLSSVNLENFIESISDFTAYLSKAKMVETYHIPIYEPFAKEVEDILSKTSLPYLTILWQIFSKGVTEVKTSHNQLIATEMLVIKAIHATTLSLPLDPKKIPKKVEEPTASSVLPKPTETKIKAPISALADSPLQIIDFLKYLYQQSEMEIYYLLLNEVEITNFTGNILEIAGENKSNINTKLKEQISSLLFAWTQQKWNVIITRAAEIVTLRAKLIAEIQAGKDWNLIAENFPDSEISDILLAQKAEVT